MRWVLAAYAAILLSIGLTADWQLRHEDNGALHTTFALSHLRLGLAQTHAHDLFANPHTGETTPYGHHPPGTALIVAAGFALARSDSPAVARLTIIAFHLGTVLLMVSLLTPLLGRHRALLTGFVLATLPMGAYFGRMVNYEPLCLFAVMLQLWGYARFTQGGHRGDLALAVVGTVLGGLIDWPSFFFAAALVGVAGWDALRRRRGSRTFAAVITTAALTTLALDVWHLWYAGHQSLHLLDAVVSSSRPWNQDLRLSRFVFGQIDTFRRYFTEFGLISVLLICVALVRPGARFSGDLFAHQHADVLKRLLIVTIGAAGAYVLAAPGWAMMHQYWQFYFLPSAALSIVLVWDVLGRIVRRQPTTWRRALQVACVLDVLISSGYWLHFRHTRVEAYAVETTATFRATFLAPASYRAPGGHDNQ